MRVFLVFVVVLLLVVSGCSSSAGGEGAGPEITSGSEESTEESVETTVAESLTGLELVLDGEPPSTTVSDDGAEQAAADVVHWETQTYFACVADLQGCDLNDYDETVERQASKYVRDRLQGWKDEGYSVLPDAREPESRILWSRRSPGNPDVVAVLACQRNYYVLVDGEGSVINDETPVELSLNLVERNADGDFLIVSRSTLETYQPESEGGDECLTFDGTEVPQASIDELLAA